MFGLWDEFADADLHAWDPVPVKLFKPTWPKAIGRSPGICHELQEFAPDICHTHGLWLYSSFVARNYNRQKRRPYVVSPHGMLDPWAVRNSGWKKKLALLFYERDHLQNAACIRALCESEARAIRDFGLKNPICIIPNGIDLPVGSIPPAPPWKDMVEPGKKVLLFLSRIHPKKGLVNLLKAWAKSLKTEDENRESSEWVLAIAGWDQGGHEQELKQLATELGLAWMDIRDHGIANGEGSKSKAENESVVQLSTFQISSQKKSLQTSCSVFFLGPQFDEAKGACYYFCDAFVLPSFSEGLPMVVLESWAYSKPVIMTPECNLPEGFQAGAALKAEATEASLIAGLNELWRMSTADRLAMGSRGRDLVLNRFTWPQIANQMQAVHSWILGGGVKPDCIANC